MLMSFLDMGINFLVKNASMTSNCMGLEPVIRIVKNVFKLIQFGVPILLILFGAIELGKAVMSSKDDEMKKAQSTLIKRLIYAVAVFLVVTIVTVAMGLVTSAKADEANASSWSKCWNDVK